MNLKLRERYVKYIAEFFNDFGILLFFIKRSILY